MTMSFNYQIIKSGLQEKQTKKSVELPIYHLFRIQKSILEAAAYV